MCIKLFGFTSKNINKIVKLQYVYIDAGCGHKLKYTVTLPELTVLATQLYLCESTYPQLVWCPISSCPYSMIVPWACKILKVYINSWLKHIM